MGSTSVGAGTRFVVLCGVLLAALSTGEHVATGSAGRPPNILLVITDDQRAKGTLDVMTATRRWLARGGVSFAKAFATTPLCCPSRASIFTGQYVHNHKLERTYNHEDFVPHQRAFQRSTIQKRLREVGYLTGLYGKYLNGWDINEDPPHFDRWAILDEYEYRGGRWNEQGKVRTIRTYSTDYIARSADAFLSRFAEERDEKPWFLVVAPNAPHAPFTPEESYSEARVPGFRSNPAVEEADRGDKPGYVQASTVTKEEVLSDRRSQLRTLMSVDDALARLRESIRAYGERRRTLIIFMSDNGYLWGEHGLTKKFAPYPASVRIPLLLRWPGRLRGGRVDRRIAANIDIAPTILDAAGVRTPTSVDGRSLLRKWARNRLLLEYFRDNVVPPWASLWTDEYQYTEYRNDDGTTSFREYYDQDDDPWQLLNLMGDEDDQNDPDLREEEQQLASDRRCEGSGCP